MFVIPCETGNRSGTVLPIKMEIESNGSRFRFTVRKFNSFSMGGFLDALVGVCGMDEMSLEFVKSSQRMCVH